MTTCITDRVSIDPQTRRITLTDRNMSLHKLYGLAYRASAVGTRPRYKLVYKDTIIGEIRLPTIKEEDGTL